MIIIAIRQANKQEWTKDGKGLYFDTYYIDSFGKRKKYRSKKFITRKDARNGELEFIEKIKNSTEYSDLTFKDLIESHYNYQSDKVKPSTMYNYRNLMVYLEPIEHIKLEDFNIRHFEMWRQFINSRPISTRYKNTIYKYLKALMNFGTKWYDFNFIKVYNKMTNFTNL